MILGFCFVVGALAIAWLACVDSDHPGVGRVAHDARPTLGSRRRCPLCEDRGVLVDDLGREEGFCDCDTGMSAAEAEASRW